MARKRIIDPDFFLDEELCQISAHARLLYIGLWGICDDNYATLPNKAHWINLQIFPNETVDVERCLGELERIGKIILFTDEGKYFWYIKNFFVHQRVDHPSRPKYPEFLRKKQVITLFSALPETLARDSESVSRDTRHQLSNQVIKEVREIKKDLATPRKEEGGEPVDKKLTAAEALREALIKQGKIIS